MAVDPSDSMRGAKRLARELATVTLEDAADPQSDESSLASSISESMLLSEWRPTPPSTPARIRRGGSGAGEVSDGVDDGRGQFSGGGGGGVGGGISGLAGLENGIGATSANMLTAAARSCKPLLRTRVAAAYGGSNSMKVQMSTPALSKGGRGMPGGADGPPLLSSILIDAGAHSEYDGDDESDGPAPTPTPAGKRDDDDDDADTHSGMDKSTT